MHAATAILAVAPYEAAVLGVAAAAGGTIFRKLVGLVAERTGHNRAEAEEAVSTAGVSLVAEEKPEGPKVDASTPTGAGGVAGH